MQPTRGVTGSRLRHFGIFTIVLGVLGCVTHKDLLEGLEDSRGPDARRGVLSNSLSPEERARLELLGRTSAPTRYTERTDANRIRVVALDFGGVELGQCADISGNLINDECVSVDPEDSFVFIPTELKPSNEVDWLDFQLERKILQLYDEPDETKRAEIGKEIDELFTQRGRAVETGAEDPNHETPQLAAGMFRQFSTQVGTTIEADVAIGPVGTETVVYISRNFLVMEWRRYREKMLIPRADQRQPYVSGVEEGIAVRIIFDVKLRTADSKVSATFGIADLSTALARNEATVEVSYEVTGTAIDPLPDEAIVITSVNEYLNALEEFHGAVSDISKAWEALATEGLFTKVNLRTKNGEPRTMHVTREHFALAQLAYYVHGGGVGDNFVLTQNVEICQDFESVEKYLESEIELTRAQMYELDCLLDSGAKRVKSKQQRAELRRLARQLEDVHTRKDELRAKKAEYGCERACAAELRRLELACETDTKNVRCVDKVEGSLLQQCAKPEPETVSATWSCRGNKSEETEDTKPAAASPRKAPSTPTQPETPQ